VVTGVAIVGGAGGINVNEVVGVIIETGFDVSAGIDAVAA
jgi:hypothetical protein